MTDDSGTYPQTRADMRNEAEELVFAVNKLYPDSISRDEVIEAWALGLNAYNYFLGRHNEHWSHDELVNDHHNPKDVWLATMVGQISTDTHFPDPYDGEDADLLDDAVWESRYQSGAVKALLDNEPIGSERAQQ